jgi:DCN1-like protein 1/2
MAGKRLGEWQNNPRSDLLIDTPCRADSIPIMQSSLPRLRDQLGTDPDYFRKVYIYTFDFARSEGQRSLGQEFW